MRRSSDSSSGSRHPKTQYTGPPVLDWSLRRLFKGPGRAGGLLGRPADDWRPGRGGSGIDTSPDRLERDLELIRLSRQLGPLGDDEAAPVVVELRPAKRDPPSAVERLERFTNELRIAPREVGFY